MINFFRKIREKLLSEGKTGKYLKYAIGEIVLVVIGILIALQINNWNESRKEHQLETKILKEILLNLETDLKNLDISITSINNEWMRNNTKVLEHLNNDMPITDSLRYYYSRLYGHVDFQPNTIGYDNLKSVGIDIIQNEQLRKEIAELYSIKYFLFVEVRRTNVRKFQDFQIEELYANIRTIKPLEIGEPINLKELRQNIRFKNTLLGNIFILEWVNSQYIQGKEDIELVAQSIRNELNK